MSALQGSWEDDAAGLISLWHGCASVLARRSSRDGAATGAGWAEEAIAADATAGRAGADRSEAAALTERDSIAPFRSRPRKANVSALTVISNARNGLPIRSCPPLSVDLARELKSLCSVTKTTGVFR